MTPIIKIFNLLNKTHKKYLFILISLGFVSMALELIGISTVIPFIYIVLLDENNKYTVHINNFFGNPSTSNLILYLLFIIFFIFLFKNLFGVFLSWLQAKFGMLIQIDFARRLITLYLNANYEFHLQKNSSELVNNINLQINQCVNAVKIVINLVTESIIIIGIFFLLLYVNIASTIIIIIIGFLSSILFYFSFRKKLKVAGEDLVRHEGQKLKNILQGFQGIKEIKVYNKVNIFLNKFLSSNNSSELVKSNYVFLQSLAKQFYEILAIFLFVSISVAVIILNSDPLNLFKIISVYAVAAIRLMPAANKIVTSLQQIRFSLKGVEIIYNEFKSENKSQVIFNQSDDANTNKLDFNDTIEFNNLSFSYANTDKKVLDEINFVINKGDIIKINGESGKGKSTIVHLLIGLLNPTGGNITIDSKDISEFSSSWKKIIGYVPQSIYLIDDTIERNIAFGVKDIDISSERLNKVIKEAQLDKFIQSLSDGLKTNVGEKGTRISGGQLQRIGIARALYNNPQVIIFDEATNSLDKKNEDEIINIIMSLKDITIIFISHNKDLLLDCNKVLEL